MVIVITTESESEYGANDATATATPELGGTTPPYAFLWDDGQTTQTATGLGTGWHSVRVTDSSGTPLVQICYFYIIPCPVQYDFNMNDSQLGCFLQVASCRFGDKAQETFEKNAKGFRDKCCDKQLFMLMKNIETAACWHPKKIVTVEDPAAWILQLAATGLSPTAVLTITILTTVFTYQFDHTKTFNVNLNLLVDYINSQDTVFKAQIDSGVLWILAPSGYNGIIPTITISNGSLTGTIVTSLGFQDGCKPCGSYVDWIGVYHEAPEDCLSEQQIANIIDNIKKFVDCKCMTTDEILNDDIE